MRNIIPYPAISKLCRFGAISSLVLLSACVTTLSSDSQGGKGSFRVDQDGQPTTSSRFAWVADNWQEFSEAINETNTGHLAIEVNQVHDGSLRVLIPATEVFVGNTLRINRKSHVILNKSYVSVLLATPIAVETIYKTKSFRLIAPIVLPII